MEDVESFLLFSPKRIRTFQIKLGSKTLLKQVGSKKLLGKDWSIVSRF